MNRIEAVVKKQREFFHTGKTKNIQFRKKALRKLRNAIHTYEPKIKEALQKDLNKSEFESYMTEIGMVLEELSYMEKHFECWAMNKRVRTPLAQFHSKSFVISEPYGVTLVMSPWNYPFFLSIAPVIGAIAAGNCCVLKPSAYSKETMDVLEEMISSVFPTKYIAVVTGGRKENTMLLEQRFDYIFFTGSIAVGKLVMEKAAKHLTPVSLELGGKSPCIVDKTANLDLAAKRIVFGKLLNCGQTCVAPDYILVDESVKEQLISLFRKWIHNMYGDNPVENEDYPKMIHKKHYDRVLGLIDGEKIVEGGYGIEKTLKIAPTILDEVTGESAVMQEEIFGPVLPVLSFTSIEEAEQFVTGREKPLALYLFSNHPGVQRRILSTLSFGGGCINDTIIHLATTKMGFGGVGSSGMGSYHGRESFDTFSHKKSIVKKYNWIDLPIRYQPASKAKENLIRHFLK